MQREVSAQMSGFQIPADSEKLKLLESEKQRDLIAALSPEEREQWELRESPLALNIRGSVGAGIRSEADYREIYSRMKAFDEQYGAVNQDWIVQPSAEARALRNEAAVKIREDLHAALGDERYAVLRRASDNDYRTLGAIARRYAIPSTAVDALYASRDRYAEQARRISEDTALAPEERTHQLQAMAGEAKAELQASLGAEAAGLYVPTADWLTQLGRGKVFSTEMRLLPNGLYIQDRPVAPKPAGTAPASGPKG